MLRHLLVAAALLVPRSESLVMWGEHGHRVIGDVAADIAPADMPAFFRAARAQLSYLNPEPDRWRDRAEHALDPALDDAAAPDHFIDLEMLPAARSNGILHAPSRLAFADSLRTLGFSASKVGILPFAILELAQRLRVEFRRWRAATDQNERAWIEQRIINDAGILGHYVADGSNPAHTTVQYNGWVGDNPDGFTTDNHFHARFETDYVQAHITNADVRAMTNASPRVLRDLRGSIIEYLRTSNGEVRRLYTLEKQSPFDAKTASPDHKQFAAERLAAGAVMLRDVWWTAWVTSAH